MNSRYKAVAPACLLLTLILTGCASTEDPNQKPVPPSQREYATGSNMPVRVRRPATEEERRKAQEDAQAMRDNAIANQPRKGP
jgi:hypothetical protein